MLRDAGGRLNGVLLEKSTFLMLAARPQRSPGQKLAQIDAAQQAYFADGYTHAQDGPTLPPAEARYIAQIILTRNTACRGSPGAKPGTLLQPICGEVRRVVEGRCPPR